MKYKKGDKVIVLSGKDKGREGVIEKIWRKESKALVPGINIYKRHIKKALARDGKGGIFEIPRPIHLSKLAVLDSKTGKPAKIGFKSEGEAKIRVNKKTGKILETELKEKKKAK